MTRTLFTLNVDNYAPAITALTMPLMRYYAEKIGADFVVLTERKFPAWPITYEKLQIYEMAAKLDCEWAIYFDADALIHPETIDWTLYLPRDTVAHNGVDMAAIRWRYDRYFQRDGRNIGSCNWCAIASDWCRDLWHPLADLTPEAAVANIFPTVDERNTVITAAHLVDDYALSRNIARFGLKVKTLLQIQEDVGLKHANFLWHVYTLPIEQKVREMRQVLRTWRIPRSILDVDLGTDDG